MCQVYILSPSTEQNEYIIGGSEEYYMNKIASRCNGSLLTPAAE